MTIPTINQSWLHRDIEDIVLSAINTSNSLCFIGDTGTGKTALAEQIAARQNKEFLRIPCDSGLEFSELLGGWILHENKTLFSEGVFLKTLQQPSIILLDEVNAMDPSKSFLLHQLLDSRSIFCKETNKTYTMHNDCKLFVACNPPTLSYQVSPTSAALANRLITIVLPEFTKDEMSTIISSQFPELVNSDFIERLKKFYSEMLLFGENQNTRWKVSIRNIINMLTLMRNNLTAQRAATIAVINPILLTDERDKHKAATHLMNITLGVNETNTASNVNV